MTVFVHKYKRIQLESLAKNITQPNAHMIYIIKITINFKINFYRLHLY